MTLVVLVVVIVMVVVVPCDFIPHTCCRIFHTFCDIFNLNLQGGKARARSKEMARWKGMGAREQLLHSVIISFSTCMIKKGGEWAR